MRRSDGERATMTGIAVATLKLARGLREKAGFTPEHAEAAAGALADAIGRAEHATSSDLRQLEQRLTIKFASMLIVALGVLPAVLRFFPVPHP
jgi:hypothetical protein